MAQLKLFQFLSFSSFFELLVEEFVELQPNFRYLDFVDFVDYCKFAS